MEDIVREARIAGQRKANLEKVTARLHQSGRLDFSDISRHTVRDPAIRDWVIQSLVTSGVARIEVDFTTGGRPRTTLVLIE